MVYIMVWVQETWGPRHSFIDLIVGLKIGSTHDAWFLTLGVVFS